MGPPRLLVFGGNGFVGTRVCKEALDTGLGVVSISRSGKPPVQDSWVPQVEWVSVSPSPCTNGLHGIIAGWRVLSSSTAAA